MSGRFPRGGALALAALVMTAWGPLLPRPAAASGYQQTNLVSDLSGMAAVTDPNLVNPWGLVQGPATPFWVSDNHSGFSTIYNGSGTPAPLVVAIPAPGGGAGGSPTGIVFNGSSNFVVSQGGKSGPAFFIFATEDGTIAGWNPNVDPKNAITMADHSGGAVFKGLAQLGGLLFATNFRQGRIDVFDNSFRYRGFFRERDIPSGFAPFGIQAVGGMLVVTYAVQDEDRHDDVAGAGNGIVTMFDPFGPHFTRFAQGGALNSPWGVAMAPADFGPFSNDLLIGNFGDGRINAYDLNGNFVGPLTDAAGNAITIPGLWALQFGNGAAGTSPNTLYFTAGIDGEEHGLFGKLSFTP